MARLKYKVGNTWQASVLPLTVLGGGTNTVTERYQQMNPALKGYMDNVTYDPSDYSNSSVQSYVDIATDGGYRGDQPLGQDVTLSTSGTYSIIDCAADQVMDSIKSPSTFTQYNVTPSSKNFFVHVNNGDIVQTGALYPSGQLRMIKTDTTYGTTFKSGNVRDLGGWVCDGGYISYNKIFRGARLNGGSVRISNTDKAMFRDLLGIQDEIDLRSNSEARNLVGGTYVKITESVFGSDIGYLHKPISNYTTGATVGTASSAMYKDILQRVIFDLEHEKPVYIHCMAGADRTGTVCAIIEALCGVSRSDMDKDYEITSFTNITTSGGTISDEFVRYRTRPDWKNFLNYLGGFSGSTFRDKVVSWCLAIGLTYDEINKLRHLLIYGYPTDLTPSGTVHLVNTTLTHSTSTEQRVVVNDGSSYTTTIAAEVDPDNLVTYQIDAVNVLMGDVNITSTAYNNGTISIASVTGDVDIVVVGSQVVVPVYEIDLSGIDAHVSCSNNATEIEEGQSYTNVLSVDSGYQLDSVTIEMNGQDVTSTAWDAYNTTISIASVTGDIEITVTASVIVIPTYTVQATLTHATLNPVVASVQQGDTYTSTVVVESGCTLDSVAVSMGGTPVQNAFDSATNTITVTNVTGNISITVTAIAPAPPNILTESFTSHGVTYSAVGYDDGMRISSSTGRTTADADCFATGFIPIVDHDVLTFDNVTIVEANSGDGKSYIGLYDVNQAKLGTLTIRLNPGGASKSFAGFYTLSKDTSSGTTKYNMEITLGEYSATIDTTNAKYARLGLVGTGENCTMNLNA